MKSIRKISRELKKLCESVTDEEKQETKTKENTLIKFNYIPFIAKSNINQIYQGIYYLNNRKLTR